MRKLLVRSAIFSLMLAAPASPLKAQNDRSNAAPGLADAGESRNQICTLTERGISPNPVRMKASEKILFFLNDTAGAQTSLKIEFGEHMAHCHSDNLTLEAGGVVQSARAFGPRDFATVCFHEPGTYPLTVSGIPGSRNTFKTSIIVE